MTETLKVIIPMAGWGTRMRPHTWSKPKPLVSVAGKTSLEHLMDMFATLPNPANVEYIFIVGPYLGELQIPAFIHSHYPNIKAHFVVQEEMKGQSHALWLARERMHGPMIMCFSDTLMETDFSFLAREEADGIAWVMPVPDPRRFGVAELDAEGLVTRFIEKPKSLDNNLVVVGCYYFKSADKILAAIEEQMKRGVMLKNEYFMTDAITIMIEHGAKFRTHEISTWLDTGTIDATLDTNRILLEKKKKQEERGKMEGVTVVEPSFIHPSAEIKDSVIGPYASIGARCKISNSRVEDSIIEEDVTIASIALKHSLIGKHAAVTGRSAESPLTLNIGDNSSVQV
jgi:glucose-1-phosphate thymidylyltransferase